MAKRITNPKAKTVEPAWYTVGWSYTEKQRGGATGGSLEVRTRSKTEAKAIVEGNLRAKGITFNEITIVKGRNPGLARKRGTERYNAELQAMLGNGRIALHAWSDVEPRPMWASPDIMPDPDATARAGWEKFMDESSYGLSVSAFPRFIILDVDEYPTLHLPVADVRNQKRWEALTSAVRDQLDYWKATHQERIERLSKAKRRSAEDAAQLKRNKAVLKELQAVDGWTYQGFVEDMLPGRKPDSKDLDNLRLYRLSNGKLIPIINLGRDQLRVDFWRRLLSLWDGPVDSRAYLLRDFLDHHHRFGGKDEVFRDLVKDTASRLRGLVSKTERLRDPERWRLLADKLELWLSDALERFSDWWSRPSYYAFVRNRATNVEEWISSNLIELIAYHHGLPIPVTTTVDGWKEFVTRHEGIAASPFSLTPLGYVLDEADESMDVMNPFSLWKDWRGTGLTVLCCDTDPNPLSLRLSLMWKAREAIVNLWFDGLGANPSIRSGRIKTYLDHHAAHGADEAALMDAVETVFLMDNPPAPMDVRYNIDKGDIPESLPDGLKAEVRAWMQEKRKGQSNLATAKRTPPKIRTLAERLEAALPGAKQAFDEMLLKDGFTNKTGEYVGPKRKGKAGIIANWDAVVEAFMVEGYPEHGGELAVALSDYIAGLKIDKRTSRMRDDQPYRLKLKLAKAYLKSKAEHSR